MAGMALLLGNDRAGSTRCVVAYDDAKPVRIAEMQASIEASLVLGSEAA